MNLFRYFPLVSPILLCGGCTETPGTGDSQHYGADCKLVITPREQSLGKIQTDINPECEPYELDRIILDHERSDDTSQTQE